MKIANGQNIHQNKLDYSKQRFYEDICCPQGLGDEKDFSKDDYEVGNLISALLSEDL